MIKIYHAYEPQVLLFPDWSISVNKEGTKHPPGGEEAMVNELIWLIITIDFDPHYICDILPSVS